MTNPKNKSNSNNNSLVEIFSIFATIIIVFIIWANYPSFMQNMDKSVNEEKTQIIIPFKDPQPARVVKQETQFEKIGEKYGTFGDSYGSLNTLFSGLAFATLIISLFMQRKELQAQREELEAQRNEIKESNKIAESQRLITEQQAKLIEQQIKDTNVQNFYNTLFKYLEEKQRKISLFKLDYNTPIIGEKVFQTFASSFERNLNQSFYKLENFDQISNEEMLTKSLSSFETVKNTQRILYLIAKL